MNWPWVLTPFKCQTKNKCQNYGYSTDDKYEKLGKSWKKNVRNRS